MTDYPTPVQVAAGVVTSPWTSPVAAPGYDMNTTGLGYTQAEVAAGVSGVGQWTHPRSAAPGTYLLAFSTSNPAPRAYVRSSTGKWLPVTRTVP